MACAGRLGGRDELSLALMDARNHSLGLYAALETGLSQAAAQQLAPDGLPAPLWLLGHNGWFQEYWIARNPLRHLGRYCPATADRAASLEPQSDLWWSDGPGESAKGSHAVQSSAGEVRAYLLESLEQTLALLEQTPDEDEALHFFRLALFHEELHAEHFVEMAQVLGVTLPCTDLATAAPRPNLRVPASRWRLGVDAGAPGFSFDHERPAHEVQVPEFEIDAQAVTWAQFIEFVDDGAYDDPDLWLPEGWAWLNAAAPGGEEVGPTPAGAALDRRRFPRFVEQMGRASGAVLQNRLGRSVRLPGAQAVVHVSWWEADAWCRWAGRRLPAEVEWDLAAATAGSRGFRWGDVREWTGSSARAYPGFAPDLAAACPLPGPGTHKVLRGASMASRPVLRTPGLRHFALPGRDHMFCGFRSCAL